MVNVLYTHNTVIILYAHNDTQRKASSTQRWVGCSMVETHVNNNHENFIPVPSSKRYAIVYLSVHSSYNGGPNAHSDNEANVEILLKDDALENRCNEK